MSNRTTLSNVPNNIEDSGELRRFLTKLVEQVNVALGNLSQENTSDLDADSDTETAVGQAVENPVSLAELNGNLKQTVINDSTSASLSELEAQVNTILAALRTANILDS